MKLKVAINKDEIQLAGIAIILIVFLNPDFGQGAIVYWGAILFCLIGFLWGVSGSPIFLNKYMIWRILFVVWGIVSYYCLSSRIDSGYAYMKDIILQSLTMLSCSVLVSKGKTKQLLKCFVMAAFITCAYACYKSGLSNMFTITLGYFTLGTQRWNSNYLGCLAAYGCLLLIISTSIYDDHLFSFRWIEILMNVTFVITVLWCGSRTALLILIIGLCGYWVISGKTPIKTLRNILMVIFAIILGFYLLMSIPSLYNVIGIRMQRLFSFITTGNAGEQSIGWRQEMIRFGIDLFKQHPIFGVGINGFQYYYGIGGSFHSTYAHNNFVEMLADGGLVGFILYYSVFYIGIDSYRSSGFKGKRYFLFLLIVILLADLSSITYQSLGVQYIIALLVSTLVIENGIVNGSPLTDNFS